MTNHEASLLAGVNLSDEWSITEVKRGGTTAGIFAVKQNEVHCFRVKRFAGHWLTRQTLENLTAPLFARYGFISTQVRKANACGHKFVSRLGFEPVGEKDGNVIYMAERLQHARY